MRAMVFRVELGDRRLMVEGCVNNTEANPRLYIIAGPNGVGKTTFARVFLPRFAECKQFVNADLIAGGLSPFSPESAAFRAGRLMLEQIRMLADRRYDFGFETTLAGRSYLNLLCEMKEQGYSIHLFFLWVQDVQVALGRIAERVIQGGHHVPEDVVRRRFQRGLQNLSCHYRAVLDSWIVFDNTGTAPQEIVAARNGEMQIIDDVLYAKLCEVIDGNAK